MAIPAQPNLSPDLQTMHWMSRPFAFLEECAASLGDSFTLDLKSHGKYVLFSHPDAVRDILSAPTEVLVASRGNRILRPLLGARSLLLLDGPDHRQQRRLILPAFHRHKISTFGETILAITRAETSSWPLDTPFSMRETMQRVSLEVIISVLFGLDAPREHRELMECFDQILNNDRFNLALIGRLEDDGQIERSALGRAFKAALGRAYLLIDAEIDRRRKAPRPEPDGVMDMLLEATDEDGNRLPSEDLRDQLVTLIATGHETTATALAWAVYWVLTMPEVHGLLREELCRDSTRSSDAIAKLPYLEAVCQETLRIYPIVPIIARWVAEPYEINGVTIDAGVTVAPAIYLTHHRDDVYIKPNSFHPSRFLARTFNATEYLPFGGGGRRCIGANLALYEMKLVLAAIFGTLNLELVSEVPMQPVRRLVTICPADGTMVKIRG